MPRNNSKAAIKARRERALARAEWTLTQYIQGIFRPDQNKSYNPHWNPDHCIKKTEITIANARRNLGMQTERVQLQA